MTPPDTLTSAPSLALALTAPPARLARLALFLDLDGVLAPIEATPEAVVPHPRRTRALKALIRALDGRVAILSGRTLAEIDRISEGASPAAAGAHGLERRRLDGTRTGLDAHPAVAEAVAAMGAFAAGRPGVRVEDKGLAAALHYRQAPDQAEAAGRLARDLAARTGLTLQPGHAVFELKTPGADKGSALDAFMDEPPFRGAVPVMVGDDLTDEHAFVAAGRHGGFGVLVGPPRPTAARHGLKDVAATLDWLEAVASAQDETQGPE